MWHTRSEQCINTGLVGKIEWYGILRTHERIILKTDAKTQCIDCRMNSTGSEYGFWSGLINTAMIVLDQ